MIRYTLRCDAGHAFESWFRDMASFDGQVKRGLVACPVCNSLKVEKAIMAPRIKRTDRDRALVVEQEPVAASAGPIADAPPEPVALISDQELELRAAIKAIRTKVAESADNVGKGFADEALKIHLGEVPHRSIYGEASPDDVQMLREEGVEFHALPTLPDDRN
ncbi:MAG: DUF1178 family protein [Bosea sp. (in: a-proteobacteria)]